jgi:nucleoid-associated protein YgaU
MVTPLNRSLIVGVIGAVIVAAAIALTYYFESRPEGPRIAEAPKKVMAGKSGAGAGSVAPSSKTTPKGLAAPEISDHPVRPKFDVVRISPTGNAVIAGRAAPHAQVTVSDQKSEVGKVTADARGEWVLIPKNSLKAGSHELSLQSRESGPGDKSTTAPAVLSKEKVILVVPEQGKDIAGREISGKSGALALSVPRDGAGGTTVLQKPAMAPGKQTANVMAAAKTMKSGSKLSVDAIDYSEAGSVEMSGRAPSDSRVQVYLDNKPLGVARTGENGVWRIKPGQKIPPGIYKLRVDQIDESGSVMARVELPFAKAKPLGKLPRDAVVFVQPGSNLWRIARNTYGKGLNYSVIYEANRDQIRNPDLIYPGQIFYLPKVN